MNSREIQCFLLEPTDRARRSLRRCHDFAGAGEYHSEEVDIGECAADEHAGVASCFPEFKDDPRWPSRCGKCGHLFSEIERSYVDVRPIWRRADTGELTTLDEAPPGAIWFFDEYLMVATPGGHWNVDMKSRNGGGWTRHGTPPNVTVSPSILIGKNAAGDWEYHGWLRDGKLIEC